MSNRFVIICGKCHQDHELSNSVLRIYTGKEQIESLQDFLRKHRYECHSTLSVEDEETVVEMRMLRDERRINENDRMD